MKPKVRFVIYRERVLGYIHPDRPDYVQVLKPSILKGDTGTYDERWISNPSDVRTASVKDGESLISTLPSTTMTRFTIMSI